ncbi:HK97 family phage prohead protease [Arthrobacter woluwensis]|uniref:HK97 family phage prohead protease n=1 Tax=Arthrobacter woluwensis TaxID=156980 RepID=UPI001AAF0A21|nr:HK97 family phage prohead protease [Arthrobacter woluwensis]QTF71760.1 HK97 family phage prohead protease [Arthrobacter woluwensis]
MTVIPTDRQTREFEIRSANSEAREFTGIGVPFGQEIEHWFGRETFDPGSVTEADQARVLWQHREPIGVITSTRETAEGFEVTGRISRTPRGDEAMTLLKDGVVRSLSIGFEPLEHTVEHRDAAQGGDLIHWTKVRAAEFSLVTFPAYDAATVTDVRHQNPTPKGTPMPETAAPDALTRADLQPLEDALTDMGRRMDVLGTNGEPENPAAQWRSMGEFLRAVASGDDAAAAFHREYTGGTTADTVMKDSFLGSFIKLVDDRRRIINTFQRGTLPATGNNVEYAYLKNDTTVVKEQAKEGDDLEFGKVEIDTKTAKVKTYGGYTELTLQAIERATIPVLNTTLKAMGMKYGQATEGAFRAAYKTLIASNLGGTKDTDWLALSATASPDELLELIVDASLLMDQKNFNLDGIHVSADMFKKLIRLKDGDNRLMTVQGTGVNQVGTLNLKGVTGSLANVPVTLLPTAAENTLAFYDAEAFETLESPGAPAQLQDQNIINLSKSFSIYGYAAITNPFPGAIIPTKPAA